MKAAHLPFLFFLAFFTFSHSLYAQTETTPEVIIKPKSQITCETHLPKDHHSDPHKLATRGIACFWEKNFVKALRYYREAYHVEPSPVLTAAIGRALQELSLPSLAKPYFIEYLNTAKLSEEGTAKIHQQLVKIDEQIKRASELQLSTSVPDATLYLIIENTQWEELGQSPLSIKLNPGQYEILVKKKGYITKSLTIEIEENKPNKTFVELHDINETFHVTQRSWRKTGSYFLYASGPLIAAGATMFTIGAIKTSDAKIASGNTQNELVKSGSNFKQIGLVVGAIGVVGVTTGIVFYLSGTQDAPKTSLLISPSNVAISHVF